MLSQGEVTMKSVARLSEWIVFTALLCFATSAFGQGAASLKVTGAGDRVLNHMPASFLAVVFDHGHGHGDGGNGNGGNGNGGNGNGYGGSNGCSGGDSGAWDDGNGGNKCAPVPEGGTALMYLSLAGLCCFGAMALRSWRQTGMRETS
jgi:hypothetical protein